MNPTKRELRDRRRHCIAQLEYARQDRIRADLEYVQCKSMIDEFYSDRESIRLRVLDLRDRINNLSREILTWRPMDNWTDEEIDVYLARYGKGVCD